ncbi:MAG: VOC family protein [Pseudomonadota bacterium]
MDLNQVLIEVRDMADSLEFYEKLGLKLIVSAETYARFELPSGAATFSILLSDDPTPGGSVLYFEVDDVDGSFAALCERGITFDSTPADQHYRWRTATFRDPAGNKL